MSKFVRLTDSSGALRIINTELISQLTKEKNGGWRLTFDGNSSMILLTGEIGSELRDFLAPTQIPGGGHEVATA